MSFLEFTEDEKLPAVTRETRSRKQHARPNYLAALAWALGGLLVAGVLLYIAAPNNTSPAQQLPLTAVSQTEAPPLIEKNVEDIRAGDLVVSYDAATGQQVFNRVVETYERTSYHLRFIETRSLETGEIQTFETTDEHPFWQVDVGWVEAADLAVGDQLLQSNGKFAQVVSTRYEAHPDGVTVYNFQVADSHSYYVSAPAARAPPVLVHNASSSYGNATKRVAFGLDERLDDFVEHVADVRGVRPTPYKELYGKGGVYPDMLESRLHGMMNEAKHIDVNLTGMGGIDGEFNTFDDILEAGRAGPFDTNVSNWEVSEVFELHNGKTTWWFEGRDVTDMLDDIRF